MESRIPLVGVNGVNIQAIGLPLSLCGQRRAAESDGSHVLRPGRLNEFRELRSDDVFICIVRAASHDAPKTRDVDPLLRATCIKSL
jgi:hypothetical protein